MTGTEEGSGPWRWPTLGLTGDVEGKRVRWRRWIAGQSKTKADNRNRDHDKMRSQPKYCTPRYQYPVLFIGVIVSRTREKEIDGIEFGVREKVKVVRKEWSWSRLRVELSFEEGSNCQKREVGKASI